jgi:protein SCO1/2
MRTLSVFFALSLLLLATSAFVAVRKWGKAAPAFHGGAFEPPRTAPDFELEGSNGSRIHLHDYLGKVIVLEFGFTHCTQVCPVTLAKLVKVEEQLGAAARGVQVIYVTVDPNRDTIERLREYLGAFNRGFLGATGPANVLEAVRNAYGIMANEVPGPTAEAPYQVSHSSFLYLIDRHAHIRALEPFEEVAEDIVDDIQLLLRQ